jgi:hypothetical protein
MFAAPSIVNPCETLLPPAGHWMNSYTVYSPTNSDWDFTTNYLNLIVAQSGIGTTLLDSSHVAATNFTAIGSSGYYGAQLPVTNGVHTVTGSQPVGVEVYGFGQADAYGYFGGIVK